MMVMCVSLPLKPWHLGGSLTLGGMACAWACVRSSGLRPLTPGQFDWSLMKSLLRAGYGSGAAEGSTGAAMPAEMIMFDRADSADRRSRPILWRTTCRYREIRYRRCQLSVLHACTVK